MSTLTSGISATPALKQFFEEARAGQHAQVSVLRVQIRGDDLVETGRKNGPANGDLMQLSEYLDERVSFLVLRASLRSWYVVTWMPEGKVSVNNRMVYAASQAKLKEAVGEACVAHMLQFTTRDEALGNEAIAEQAPSAAPDTDPRAVSEPSKAPFIAPKPTGLVTSRTASKVTMTTTTTTTTQFMQKQAQTQRGVFVKKIDPRLAMSGPELQHVELLQQEDDARTEQMAQMQARLNRTAPENPHSNTGGQKQTEAAASGGFHSVELPLTTAAETALHDFANNVGTTVVELNIDAQHVSSARSFASTEEFVPNSSEPRFYVMRTPGSRAFVYSCPEASPPRLRMVYSTAATPTLLQIQRLGCRITHRLSLFSAHECTLIAVAATIRNGQAQRVDDYKPVSDVVSYQPSAPARSLPSRFAPASTRQLDAFTDESGFRAAFSSVRPDAPAPEPFVRSNSDAVDSAPNSGAAAWGVRLKSNAKSKPTAASKPSSSSSAAVSALAKSFSQTRLNSGESSPTNSQSKPTPEVMRSSLPGLRPVSQPPQARDTSSDKWDPWRPVSTSGTAALSNKQRTPPESALQSSVYARSNGPVSGSIAEFMSDITYPPLQNTAVLLLLLSITATTEPTDSAEHAQEFSIELFNRMAGYVAAQSRVGNEVVDIRDIPLAQLNLGSSGVVRDILDQSTPSTGGSLLDIPFGDVFALQPSSVRYIASLLEIFSRVDPKFTEQFAPMFGISDSQQLGSSENMESVAKLVATIGAMDSSSLSLVSQATRINMANDPLVKRGSLFKLANLLNMSTERVEHVAKLFDSILRLQTSQLQTYLHDIGWESTDIQKSSSINPIPNLSYVFPLDDSILDSMANAAKEYSKDNTKPAQILRPKIQEYLHEARDFLDFIPGYSTVSSLIGLSNNPIVNALTQIISLSYKYPNASYWELAIQYYKNIGMPGLNSLSSYPSQYIGGLASEYVGGYISDAISGLIDGILGPGVTSESTPTTPASGFSSNSISPSFQASTPSPTSTLKSSSKTSGGSSTNLMPSSSSSESTGDSGFWGGIFSIFTTTNVAAPAPPMPSSSTGVQGTVMIAPKVTPPPTASAFQSHSLQATLNLNSNQSTRVTYTLASQPEMLILT
ncbi:Twinfilin-1, partial [Coemansia brasiliensis]